MKTLRLILGDQLNQNHSWFSNKDENIIYVLMEMMQEQEYVTHHIQKICCYFAAMEGFSDFLKSNSHRVNYMKLDDEENHQKLEDNLNSLIKKFEIEKFEYILPDEYRLDEQLKKYCNTLSIDSDYIDSEHFLNSRNSVQELFAQKKSFLMETFYRKMRKDHKILMDGEEPIGGKWNFDAENRKKYDGKVSVPDELIYNNNLSSQKKRIDKMKVNYFGNIEEEKVNHPINRAQGLMALNHFCEKLLPHFGTYEDAMTEKFSILFHSRISFALNTKMIHPKEVISAVTSAWENNLPTITIAQVEGFVRQVIGWREYMRGIYWAKMPEFANLNYFNHQAKLPDWFWTGKTKMNCLHHCISNSLDNAYAHHIQRLMVIGNFCLLTEINPNEVDEWYLGVYIDAIEWVEITNTRGMSQFADGGIVGTKPYISSANYIDKMSDYCKNCHYDKKLKTGELACPFNSLYWDFYHRNRESKLRLNQRVSMMFNLLEKMDKNELKEMLDHANSIKKNIEIL